MQPLDKNTQVNEWEIDNLPNRLTIFRIILIPVVVLCLYAPELFNLKSEGDIKILNYLAALLFILASFTDFLDGYFARKLKIVTVFGSFLDPIADKFLVISSLIILQATQRVHPLIVLILVLRELYMTALRLLALEKGITIPVSSLGKWKTATQMMAIPLLMAKDDIFHLPIFQIGSGLIMLASLFSLYSALEYSMSLVAKVRKMLLRKKRNNQSHQS